MLAFIHEKLLAYARETTIKKNSMYVLKRKVLKNSGYSSGVSGQLYYDTIYFLPHLTIGASLKLPKANGYESTFFIA